MRPCFTPDARFMGDIDRYVIDDLGLFYLIGEKVKCKWNKASRMVELSLKMVSLWNYFKVLIFAHCPQH